jgi:hydrogenase maturation protease
MNFLIVGYGNTLRSDDGAGQIVAERVAAWNLPNVRSLAVHQLTPELAAELANADTVVFVDAVTSSKQKSEKVTLKTLSFDDSLLNVGHISNPRSLLHLSKSIYNKTPQAYWILIPAINFEFGEKVSKLTKEGIEQSLEKIQQIINVKIL